MTCKGVVQRRVLVGSMALSPSPPSISHRAFKSRQAKLISILSINVKRDILESS